MGACLSSARIWSASLICEVVVEGVGLSVRAGACIENGVRGERERASRVFWCVPTDPFHSIPRALQSQAMFKEANGSIDRLSWRAGDCPDRPQLGRARKEPSRSGPIHFFTYLILAQKRVVHVGNDVKQRVAHAEDGAFQAGRHGELDGWVEREAAGEKRRANAQCFFLSRPSTPLVFTLWAASPAPGPPAKVVSVRAVVDPVLMLMRATRGARHARAGRATRRWTPPGPKTHRRHRLPALARAPPPPPPHPRHRPRPPPAQQTLR